MNTENIRMNEIKIDEILEKIQKNKIKKVEDFQFEFNNYSEKNRVFIVHYFEQMQKNLEN